MPEKLKRCPCCGGKAEIRYHQIPTQGRSAYQISCSRCVLATSWIGSPEEVIYFWNRAWEIRLSPRPRRTSRRMNRRREGRSEND